MRALRSVGIFGACIVMLLLALPAAAQLTTGSVGGTVKDAQGGVIPGATVTLVSETRGTRSIPVTTDANGDFVFPNVTADTYTIEVEMPSFKTLRQSGIAVSPGPRVAVGVLTIEVGGAAETVTVKGEAPLIQAASGERSFTIPTESVAEPADREPQLPAAGAARAGRRHERHAGAAARLDRPVDHRHDGRRLDDGYRQQRRHRPDERRVDCRSEGAGVRATRPNTAGRADCRSRRSPRAAPTGSAARSTTCAATPTGTPTARRTSSTALPKPILKQQDIGYSIGGPIGKPGGNNKLFFFHALEFLPRTGGNDAQSFRMPTALERHGDFSQTPRQPRQPVSLHQGSDI